MIVRVRIGSADTLIYASVNQVAAGTTELAAASGLNRHKVIGAMLYPIIIACATLGITGLLTAYIFPKIMPILQAEALRKHYHHRTVVNNVSLSIKSGQIVGLLGPNGAGKTTSFYMIVGLTPPDFGAITLDQQDITHLPIHKRARLGIGYLPQEKSIFRKLTVADNVMAILELRSDLTTTLRKNELEKLLAECHI